ncbi:hypothetical protein Mal52_11020 [Symmachiella dynata]|uniref:DNA mimic protein DMP19 C-terminal domain-containing protein n=1 Tax=Symmachiella dynata TaxID=2527995 RepID=A0A517ZJG7_9PLAN|nr:DUF4375 domain-containing protein [Symmachiella dynata]QDU42635.1 hypothetical protein Mal52_11020 [Symmachiella dynata]
MDGETVESRVFQWLEKYYPDGVGWQNPDSDCLGDAPIEIKLVAATNTIEYNISNGGWGQFLWNCHGTWRRLLAIGHEGYKLIGADAQADALQELGVLCERDIEECREYIRRADAEQDFKYPASFTAQRVFFEEDHWTNLFYSTSGVYEKRLEWLEKNQERVLEALMYVPG